MPEQRRHFRKKVDWTIEFVGADGVRGTGICRDLSLGGMHVDTASPAQYGSQITVVVQLKGFPAESKLRGTVRWTKAGSMGVQFGLMGAQETYALTKALSEPDGP